MIITYFAYGSNMSPSVIEHVCPSSRLLGPAILVDHKLAFSRKSAAWNAGVADIIEAKGAVVWGALYEIHESDLPALDGMQGYPRAYTRIKRDVLLLPHKALRSAMTYTVAEKSTTHIAPCSRYLDLIVEGLEALDGMIDSQEDRWLWESYVRFVRSITAIDVC